MQTIQEELLYTTLRIECYDSKQQPFSFGTGFLLNRPIGDGKSKLYLVSNKHVLFGAESISLTFTKMKDGEPSHGSNLKVPISGIKTLVVGHPSADVDIAVIDCTGLFVMMQDHIFYKSVPYNMISDFTEPELNVAENVLFVGYPDNRYDVINNLPLVRQGLIASHPKLDYNGAPLFIIDAQVFPGSSGSPVYIDLTFEDIKNGQLVIGEKKIKLLGIISQTMIRNNKLVAVPVAAQVVSEEVIGLGVVFKSTLIKELVDSIPID